MKNILYKTRYIWTVLFALWLGFMLTGCSTYDAWVKSVSKGGCVAYAEEVMAERQSKGLPSKIVVGYMNGIRHMWVVNPESGEIIDEFEDWNVAGERVYIED